MIKKKQGYLYGGTNEGSYWCPQCKRSHHKLSVIGKKHKIYSQ